jgi:hypothetical protein
MKMNDEEATTSKDQKLAHFQEVTHLDDFEQCQAILESTNWDLDQAIQSYYSSQMSHDDDIDVVGAPLAPPPPTLTAIDPRSSFERRINIVSPQLLSTATQHESDNYEQSTVEAMRSASASNAKRLLQFNIEYLGNKVTLHLFDNESVGKIKELVEEKLAIPRHCVQLGGWRNKPVFINDHTIISELNLPLETTLYVTNSAHMTATDGDKARVEQLASAVPVDIEFELLIKLVARSDDKFFRIRFSPNVTFIEIRRRLSMLTSLIVNDQEWWYFKTTSDSFKSKLDEEKLFNEFKELNSVHKLQSALDDDKLLGVSLNSIVEDNLSLSGIKMCLDELTQSNNNNNSSKLTPSQSSSVVATSDAFATASSVQLTEITTIKLLFVVNNKNSNQEDASSSQASSSAPAFSQTKSGSHNDSSNAAATADLDDDDEDLMTHEDDLVEQFLLPNDETAASSSSSSTGGLAFNKKKKPLISSECPLGDEMEGTCRASKLLN